MGSLKFSMSEQLTAVWLNTVRNCTQTVAHELYSIRILLHVIMWNLHYLWIWWLTPKFSKYSSNHHHHWPQQNLLMINTCLFISFSQYMEAWNRILYPQERGFRCPYYIYTWHTAESAYVSIRAGRFYEGPFRCVSDAEDVTAPDNSSEVLSIKVHCECLGWY